jgi:hypothetical protein
MTYIAVSSSVRGALNPPEALDPVDDTLCAMSDPSSEANYRLTRRMQAERDPILTRDEIANLCFTKKRSKSA